MIIGFLTLENSANTNPVASKQAQVISGNARFTVLTPQLIRLEWDENGKTEDQASLVVINRHLEPVDFTQKIEGQWLHIKTDSLLLKYKVNSGRFTRDSLSISFQVKGEWNTWYPGQKDPDNLGGTSRTLDGMNGGIDWNGKPVDLGQGILSRSGWFLLDDSNSHLLDDSDWAWVEPRQKNHRQDYYFFGHGLNYKQALKDYTQIAGAIPIPPRFAFGYWWSRYWVYSDTELKALMEETRQYDIPIDVLVIDMDWHLTHGGLKNIENPERDPFGELLGWTGYTWNKELFPEPKRFLDWTEAFNLKTALNLHPASGIAPMESQYQEFAKAYDFDSSENAYIPYKMGEKTWASIYFDKVLRPLEKEGVDFWWLDWQQYPESKVVEGLNNTWWLNHTFFTDMERQGTRPLLFHRWGGMGNHRYQIGFSGDDKISWGSLDYQSYFTATAANVGYGYWSHDIGGHGASELGKDPELYTRWIQFGILSPIFRTHSAKISTIERRFWMYPEHFSYMRDLVKFRYALNPYIYTAAHQAHKSGVSIVRPMYYDHPEQDAAYSFKNQYMFGDDLLVAPIATPVSQDNLVASKKIWLPKGLWYEWDTGTLIDGEQELKRHYALNEIPLFAKAGSVIPMYPDINNLQHEVNHWVLSIIPGGSGKTTIYDDDGKTSEYKNNTSATTKVTNTQNEQGSHRIVIHPSEGKFSFNYKKRAYDVKLLSAFPPKRVTVNNKNYPYSETSKAGHWSYNGRDLSIVINIPETKIKRKVVVDIVADPALANHRALLNGKVGQFKRITKAVADIKVETARINWWATLPNRMLGAEQTPSKIQYTPTNILSLLQTYNDSWPRMLEQITEHSDIRPEVATRYIRFLDIEHNNK